jgi:phage tail-like protein
MIDEESLVQFDAFGLDIDGVESEIFSISGFGGSITSHKVTTNSKDGKRNKINFAGNTNVQAQDISATRPLHENSDWWDWFAACANGESDAKKTGSVIFYSQDTPKVTFKFEGALVDNYSIGASDSNDSATTTEIISFSIEKLTMDGATEINS